MIYSLFLYPLGMNEVIGQSQIITWDEMLPAVAQGAIGIQCRSDDTKALKYLAALNHKDTKTAIDCERSFLATLDGNCRTPIAGQAKIIDGKLHFRGLISKPDGTEMIKVTKIGNPEDAVKIGEEVKFATCRFFFVEIRACKSLIHKTTLIILIPYLIYLILRLAKKSERSLGPSLKSTGRPIKSSWMRLLLLMLPQRLRRLLRNRKRTFVYFFGVLKYAYFPNHCAGCTVQHYFIETKSILVLVGYIR